MEETKNQPTLHYSPDKDTTPILKFPNNETLQAYLKYWQHVLHLDDWYIKAALVDELRDEDGEDLAGQNICTAENKEAFIKISCNEPKGTYMRHCEELALLHELLHCFILRFKSTNETMEAALYDLTEHQKIETLAKAFIMARYGVNKEWFFKEA